MSDEPLTLQNLARAYMALADHLKVLQDRVAALEFALHNEHRPAEPMQWVH
jgi:hypothetical protein